MPGTGFKQVLILERYAHSSALLSNKNISGLSFHLSHCFTVIPEF